MGTYDAGPLDRPVTSGKATDRKQSPRQSRSFIHLTFHQQLAIMQLTAIQTRVNSFRLTRWARTVILPPMQRQTNLWPHHLAQLQRRRIPPRRPTTSLESIALRTSPWNPILSSNSLGTQPRRHQANRCYHRSPRLPPRHPYLGARLRLVDTIGRIPYGQDR